MPHRHALVPTLAVSSLVSVLALFPGCGRIGFDNQPSSGEPPDAAIVDIVDAATERVLDAGASCTDESDCSPMSFGPAVTVPGNANIYGAGHAVPPAPGGGGAGILPPSIALPTGTGRLVQITSVTGGISIFGSAPTDGPDGIPVLDVHEAGFDGISGYWADANGALAAVFVDENEPTDPRPADLRCGDLSYESLSPRLNQVFVIGDGQTGTGTGTRQTISVPNGATRLFIGLSDSSGGDPQPGAYGDNVGSFSVTGHSFVPD